jgi:hypothetical protein
MTETGSLRPPSSDLCGTMEVWRSVVGRAVRIPVGEPELDPGAGDRAPEGSTSQTIMALSCAGDRPTIAQ